jgi:hypothetical protein
MQIYTKVEALEAAITKVARFIVSHLNNNENSSCLRVKVYDLEEALRFMRQQHLFW